ncbi:MAG: glycosyltransferase family 4 protein, partial [Candidatus Nanoarchaeia archaeon]
MKILHVTPFFLPYFGGIEYYVYYISRELVKRGHSVSIYTSKTAPNLPEKEYIDGMLVRRFLPTQYFFGYPLILKLLEELLKSEADLIHCHISGPIVTELAATASKLKGLPLVITIHQCALPAEDVLTEKKIIANILVAFYNRLFLVYDLTIAKKIIVVSPSTIKLVGPLVKHPDKLVLIPDGVDTELF